jgi:hypothetical protein
MAITKSYTFTNGTTIDPDEVNQNFDDILDAIKGAHHQDADGTLIAPADINASWGLVPVGGIILWSGLISAIPSGYHFCNGADGTVDLRNRFVICPGQDTGGTYDTGDTGGSATINIAHTHTGPSHTHTIPTQGPLGYTSAIGDGYFERNTWPVESHNHGGVTGASGTGNTGSALSASQSVLPPYKAVVFIQKI